MALRPVVLLVPSRAAAVELPRRVALTGHALAGIYAFTVRDLARALAEPRLLGSGLKPWDRGHDAFLAERLLEQQEGPHVLRLPEGHPPAPTARALAQTFADLRGAEIAPERLDHLAAGALAADQERLRALATLYRRFLGEVDGRFADETTLLRTAAEAIAEAAWLQEADVLIADELELDPLERRLLAALARRRPTRRLERPCPAGMRPGSFAEWARAEGIELAAPADTFLAPVLPPAMGAGLQRLQSALFEPPAGEAAEDDSVELLTAAGEAAEAAAVARRLLREARRGVPFEEMGVLLPRAQEYALVFTDLLSRLGIPHRLHPSLPLRCGRYARSLLLLLRCRGLARAAVMEFLTFAPVPFEELLGAPAPPPSRWDQTSRDARIVSGLDRWQAGLRAHAQAEREAAAEEGDDGWRERRLRRAADAESLLGLVEALQATLETLSGERSWPEWSARLLAAFDRWTSARGDHGQRLEHQAVREAIADLAGLGALRPRAGGADVEAVLESRLEWERMPLEPRVGGAVHVGALDALAGVPFRVVAIPGLAEGGFPSVLRPDPLLLDAEREALSAPPHAPDKAGQLALFPDRPADHSLLRTTHDRLLAERRAFHRAVGQAKERLLLSYPRADARDGRERLPSLFFATAASALAGRPLDGAELLARVHEDSLDALAVEDALDRGERDRQRVRRGGEEAALAVAAGSAFFKQSRLATAARRSARMTAYDGLVAGPSGEVPPGLDPLHGGKPVSASRLATFAGCGFQYLLKNVLRLEPALEPEERRRIEPLERGNLFHKVAERFLRERRDQGLLPVRDDEAERARLMELADEATGALVAGSPPRYLALWERERRRFRETLLAWLSREAEAAFRTGALPAHFEVSFGPGPERAAGEPHAEAPLVVDLPDGRRLAVSGKIDRIDRRPDGGLVLRDYKTGRAPWRDDAKRLTLGNQLQVPLYVLAAAHLFPGSAVAEAFLDYVDGGRRVTFTADAAGDRFRARLFELVTLLGQGVFLQEPATCAWCDYTAVCGPQPLLEWRLARKSGDPRVQRVRRLREQA